MSKARLHSSILLVFAVAACGGDESGITGDDTAFVTLKRRSTPVATPPPAPAPAPAPVTASTGSLLPYIDNAKIPTAAVGFSTVRIRAETNVMPTQNTDGTGQFRFTCDFSHMSYDDPIVFPGRQGATHLHTFFGNTGINYASTQASIETSGNSTCAGGPANRTGYWVPSIIDTKDGTPIKPDSIMVYYKTGHISGTNVKPFPAGLRMISGDMKSTGPQENQAWNCYTPDGKEYTYKNIPELCPAGSTVVAGINFPFCWDGVNLDSPDHKSHMSFPVWNNDKRVVECPTSHPVELPMITEQVKYLVKETGETARWRLSSDNYGTEKLGGFSLHADWFNGWDAKVQDIWVKNCLIANRDCHGFLLGDGTALF